jgi:hypothetical protein
MRNYANRGFCHEVSLACQTAWKEGKGAMKAKLTQEQQDRAVRLMLAYLCIATESKASLIRKVEILDKFDLPDREIAKVCGCTIPSVANARVKRRHR